ncbi:RNA-directed DNA polymerase, eukaryota [Tanacetum coccineum]
MVDTFRRPSRGGAVEEQLSFILSRMDDLILTNIPNRWVWSLKATGEFSVKYVRQLIDDSVLPKEEVATRWVKVIPIKINVFACRVRLDKLPTRLNLSLKGIDILTIICPLCHASVESGSHIFFSCPMARHLWRKLMRWWDLEDIDLASYDDWLQWLNSSQISKRLKEILKDLQPNSNFTFIGDRQKGIIPAIKSVFLSAEYRFCLRHIHENMKQGWNGQAYKDLLWRFASATTVRDFENYMLELKKMNPKIGRPTKKRKRSKLEDKPFVKDDKLSKKPLLLNPMETLDTIRQHAKDKVKSSNNVEASDIAPGQAKQAEPVVGQDGSGGSGVGQMSNAYCLGVRAVIGLSVAGRQPGHAGVRVESRSSSPNR